MTSTWSWPCAAGDAAAAVRVSSSDDEGTPSAADPLSLRQPPAGGPLELTLELPPASSVQRCRVWSSSRTVEAQTQAPGSANWEYACSAKGLQLSSLAPGAYLATLALPGGSPHGRLRLKLLSLAPPGCCVLWGVAVEVAPAKPRADPASGAAMAALLAAMGKGKLQAAPLQVPVPGRPAAESREAGLEARVAQLEGELAALKADYGARLAALERTGAQ